MDEGPSLFYEVELDPDVYSDEAVLSTAYWFSNKFIILKTKTSLKISLKDGNALGENEVNSILIRLADEELRIRLRKQFHEIEKVIIKKAFSSVDSDVQKVK